MVGKAVVLGLSQHCVFMSGFSLHCIVIYGKNSLGSADIESWIYYSSWAGLKLVKSREFLQPNFSGWMPFCPYTPQQR